MKDTAPAAAAIQVEVLRKLVGAERLLLAFQMSFIARELSLARLRHHHPEWSETELRRELLRYVLHPAVPPPVTVTIGDVFGRIVRALEQAGIPYMLTGSFASAYHGTPRATLDIDIVIAPSPDQLKTLMSLFPESEYYADLNEALEAHSRGTQFNVVDLATGWKVDFVIRKERRFSRIEFDRRQRIELHELRLFVATAEDLIVAKLEWAKLGQSQRQIEDAAGILRIQSSRLDRAYMIHWIGELDLRREWEAACRLAGAPTE